VLVGAPFYRQAWHGLKYGSANMGLLVALGTTAAFGDSLFSMALAAADPSYHGHVYFESSVLILVFVCAGKYIEAKAKARTSDAVRGLLQLGAKSAMLLTLGPDGETVVDAREIPAELIQVMMQQPVACRIFLVMSTRLCAVVCECLTDQLHKRVLNYGLRQRGGYHVLQLVCLLSFWRSLPTLQAAGLGRTALQNSVTCVRCCVWVLTSVKCALQDQLGAILGGPCSYSPLLAAATCALITF
jgi:hypothetical protein